MDRYMCIKSFSVEEFGDDGLPKENELFVVGKGSVWGVSNEKYRFAAGKCSTRLEAEDGSWLEVYDDKIAHNFKRIQRRIPNIKRRSDFLKDEIERLKIKVENEEELTFSEIYFLQTVAFLSSAFE